MKIGSKYKKYFDEIKQEKAMQILEENRLEIHASRIAFLEGKTQEKAIVLNSSVAEKKDGHCFQELVITKDTIHRGYCTCNENRDSFWYSQKCCSHLTAAVLWVEQEVVAQGIDLYTEKNSFHLLDSYVNKELGNVLEHTSGVDLVPSLTMKLDGRWYVSFRIGADKKYVIKNLTAFVQAVREESEIEYGKDFKLLHKREAFSQQGELYLDFIVDRIDESVAVRQMQKESRYDVEIKRELPLTASSVDKLMSILDLEQIECNVEDGNKKSKILAPITRENPKLSLLVVPQLDGDEKMSSLELRLERTCMFLGQENNYCLRLGKIHISDKEFFLATKPLFENYLRTQRTKLVFGPNVVQALYLQVIDKIRSYIEIIEQHGDKIREVFVEELAYKFYLDENETGQIVVEVRVYQGANIIDYSDFLEQKGYMERSNKLFLKSIFQKYSNLREQNLYFIKDDLETNYQFLTVGTQELANIGEVHISDRLQRMKVRPTPKISVGVQVKSDLLNLQLQSDDIDFLELNEILDSYKKKRKFHRLRDGSFLPLDGEGLDTISELMEGLQLTERDFTKEELEVPAYRALYIDQLLQGKDGIQYERDGKLKEIVRNFRTIDDSDFEVPKHLKSVLRPYQKTGYRWMCLLAEYGFNGILADDMGLGKTLQVITLLQGKKNSNKTQETSLIVTPASLVYNWESEISKFAPELKVAVAAGSPKERTDLLKSSADYDVIVTSYDLLKRDIVHYQEVEFYYEIIDEAQYIKNQGAQVTKAVKVIQSQHRLALTGTPIENRLSELWSIFDYLMPGYLYQYSKFKSRYETPIVRKTNGEIAEHLKHMVAPFILRRLKQDVLKDLPDKIEELVQAKMDKKQEELYTANVAKLRESLDGGEAEFQKNKFKVLAEITKLRQICCDPSLIYENYHGTSAKLETCMELISNAKDSGHKILLFSQFTSMLEILEARLAQEGVETYKITGATPKAQRLQLVDEFNKNQVPVFLISLKAGGTGLNLTGADIVIHYDPWWNVAAQNQATDRAHRIGQKKVVTVYQIIAKGSIEEKIVKMQETKKKLADQIISGEENQLSAMTQDDFMDLLSQ